MLPVISKSNAWEGALAELSVIMIPELKVQPVIRSVPDGLVMVTALLKVCPLRTRLLTSVYVSALATPTTDAISTAAARTIEEGITADVISQVVSW